MRSSKGPASNGQRAAGWSMDEAEVGRKDGLSVLCIGQTAEVPFLQVLSVRELRQRKRCRACEKSQTDPGILKEQG